MRALDLVYWNAPEPTLPSARVNTINFIKEDDGWLPHFCCLKQQTQLTLSLSNPLAETVRSFAHEECYFLVG